MMDLKDLPLHIQKAIRGVRHITTRCLPKRRGPNGRPLCYWCSKEVTGARRTWCSDACVNKFVDLQMVRETIYERDQGKCRVCRVDIAELKAELTRVIEIVEQYPQKYSMYIRYQIRESELKIYWDMLHDEVKKYPAWFSVRGEEVPKIKRTFAFEIDHIVPVKKGGTTTACNLRLLCCACHDKTRGMHR